MSPRMRTMYNNKGYIINISLFYLRVRWRELMATKENHCNTKDGPKSKICHFNKNQIYC